MKQERIEWLLENNKYFKNVLSNSDLEEWFELMSDETFNSIKKMKVKKPVVTFLLSFYFGVFGIDRYYLKDWLGIIKFFTFGGIFVWWLYDLVNFKKLTYKCNAKRLLEKIGLNKDEIKAMLRSDDFSALGNTADDDVVNFARDTINNEKDEVRQAVKSRLIMKRANKNQL